MDTWHIRDYVTEDGHNLLMEWYEQQDESVQAGLDHAVLLARATDNWTNPEKGWFKELTEKHAGLSEFRLKVKSRLFERKFRPVGVFQPTSREFTFILGCEKKMGGLIYVPAKAFDLALAHKADMEAGKGTLHEHA